jgi:acetyltransferase-like isoleucine patch superfamily enzyme
MKPIVSKNIRLRHPEHFVIGDDSIVDDFCYISTKVRIGRGSHIAANCTVGGGPSHTFTLGDFSSLSAGVTIWCATTDYTRDLVVIVPQGIGDVPQNRISGDVTMERYTGVGANSVVLPDNHIPEGTVIGALSFVPSRFKFEPWSVYAGSPIRLVRQRDRVSVLAQVQVIEDGLRLRDSG